MSEFGSRRDAEKKAAESAEGGVLSSASSASLREPPCLFPYEPKLAPDAPRGLGRAILGGAGVTPRRGNDYYPTPPAGTRALLRAERAAMVHHLDALPGSPVWEPCGRGGAIARVLNADGLPTIASDIVADPDHGVVAMDLLQAVVPMGLVVVTNPPFALASEMIVHLLHRLRVPYLALLLKSTFWAAAVREPLLRSYPVARRYDLNWRLDFTHGGSPTMECSWFVWDAAAERKMCWDVLGDGGRSGSLFEGN